MSSEFQPEINEIRGKINELEREMNTIKKDNYIETDLKIKKIREKMTNIDKQLQELSISLESLSTDEIRPLMSEYKDLSSEFRIIKSKIDKIDADNTQKMNWYKFKNGEITGLDAAKVERKEYENQYHEVENQGEIINVIKKDVLETNENLKNIGVAINKQGETIDNARYIVHCSDEKMDIANKITNKMICTAKCMKCSLCFLIILLLILNILLGLLIIFKKFVWK